MKLKCKYCGHDIELSEQEAAAIRADLDHRYTREEQERLPMSVICGSCVPAHTTRLVQAAAEGVLRLKRIRSERTRRPSIRRVAKRRLEQSMN